MRTPLLIAILLFAGCGGDEPPPPPPPAPTPAAPRAPAAARGKPGAPVATLTPRPRAEDRVACPTPTDAKKCEPGVPVCGTNEFCIPAGTGHYCGPCPERLAIRHSFKPRDFQGSDLRDPFQSFVINQPGLTGLGAGTDGPIERTEKCMRRDQMVAVNSSYQALKLVGIVAQGTQRKVLMIDASGLGHIIKKADCVGKEKAIVKDIGAGYVTFVVTPGPSASGKSEPEEHSVQLYPMQVSLNAQTDDPGARTGVPIVAPPGQQQSNPPNGGNTIKIDDPPPPQRQPVQPPQAPTQLRP